MAWIRERGAGYEVRWTLKSNPYKQYTKQFRSHEAAVEYCEAINCGGFAPVEFYAPLPRNGQRKVNRDLIAEAFRRAHSGFAPATCPVVVHVLAEVPPSAVVPDVDNLLKPIMDALGGLAYVNDTLVVECTVRKVPSPERRVRVKIMADSSETSAK